MRRLSALVFVLALTFPLAGSAGSAIEDPDGSPVPAASSNGVEAPGTAIPAWLDSLLRTLLFELGL